MHSNWLTLPYNINHREKCMFTIPANYLVIKLSKLILIILKEITVQIDIIKEYLINGNYPCYWFNNEYFVSFGKKFISILLLLFW